MNSNRRIKKILIFALVTAIFFWNTDGDVKADFVFGIPENIGPAINTSGYESIVGISTDYLSFYFLRIKTTSELWLSTRVNKNESWGDAQYLGPITLNDIPTTFSSFGFLPGITTADGLECYLGMEFPGGYGRSDIWFMKREKPGDAWGALENLGLPINTLYDEFHACISPDGLELYFSERLNEGAFPGGYGSSDIWFTTRATRDSPWSKRPTSRLGCIA